MTATVHQLRPRAAATSGYLNREPASRMEMIERLRCLKLDELQRLRAAENRAEHCRQNLDELDAKLLALGAPGAGDTIDDGAA